jgi:uncharacterized repeat protein (TIGR01451 family)
MREARRLFERLEERILLDAVPDVALGAPDAGFVNQAVDVSLTFGGAPQGGLPRGAFPDGGLTSGSRAATSPVPYQAEAVTWPAEGDWMPLTDGGTYYSEPVGESGVGQDDLDLVGDATFSAGYWYSNGTELMFRLRLDELPTLASNNVWQVLFDFDGDGYVDWSLQLDLATHEEVELVPAIIGGPKFKSGSPGPGDAVQLSEVQAWPNDGTTTDPSFYRLSVAGDGSAFGGDADAFVDIGIPWADFTAATGIAPGDDFRVALTTSASHQVTNQDTPTVYTYDDWSDPINCGGLDLAITKDDGLTSVQPGDTVTYTVTISNVGDEDATGVVATDTIPDYTTFVSASDGGTESGGVVTWPTFDLAVGASVTRTVTVTVDSPAAAGVDDITNTATVADDGTHGPDTSTGNNTATDTDVLEAYPDLTITKDDGLTEVMPGDTVVYTLTITNVGDQDATGVAVTDTLPAGVTFVDASDGGTESGGVVSWPTFDLGAGASVVRTVTVTVDDPVAAGIDEITDTAVVTDDEANGADPTPGNNTDTDTDTVIAAPDLTITKDDGLTEVVPGQTVVYTLTVTNVGDQDATGVEVTDTLPADTSFVSASDAGVEAGGVVTWTIGALGAGETVYRTVTIQVDDPVAAGIDEITDTAVVTDDEANGADPTPGNNTATDTDTVNAAPDLTITKDDGLTEVVPGQTVVYTLTITNVGDQDATGVEVTDTLPANTSFVSASDGGVEAGGVVTWTIGALGAGETVYRTVTIQVDDPVGAGVEQITDTAEVMDDGANGADPTPGNNTDTDTDTVIAAPDLTITKDDGLTEVMPGDTVVYTLTITNVGDQDATGVEATDTLPANTSFVSASDGGSESGGVVTWTIGPLAAGASVQRTVTVQVDSAVPAGVDQITDTAEVTDDGANGADPTPGNNTDTDTDTVIAAPDLRISKDDGLTVVEPGDTVVYTLTITNDGNQDATGVEVTDTLPANTSFVSASDGGSESGGVVTWSIGALGVGETVYRTVTVQVDDPVPPGVDEITNTADAADDGGNGPDLNPADNTATDTDTVMGAPDLTITKDDGLTEVMPGDTVVYTLTITNVGNRTATGVAVSDTIPDDTTFGSASDGGTESGGVVSWPTFDLAAGGAVTRTVAVTVDSPAPAGLEVITNTADVADDGSYGADPTPENNTATDTDTVIAAPDLTITKDDGLTEVVPGQTVVYTLTITNVGDQDATGVEVTDTLPANTSFVSASDGGVEAGGVVTWTIGALGAGETVYRTVTIQVDATVPAGVDEITNSANVGDDETNGLDPTPGDNTDTDTDTLDAAPDLAVLKDDALMVVQPGDTLTYTVTISNLGDQGATGVVVTDTLPDYVSFVSASGGGVEAGGVVTWSIGPLAAGESVVRTVTVGVDGSVPAGVDSITNAVVIADDSTNGADPDPANNTAVDTDTVDAVPDLTITKSNEPGPVYPGQTVTYALTITNNGDQDATGVVVADTLPAYTTFVSASDGGTESGGVVTWSIGALAAGETAYRSVTVQVDATVPAGVGSITNTANVADDGANGTDPNPGDNTGTDTDTLDAAPDLTISKDDGLTQVVPGQTLTYTLTISNDGDQDATGVVVADTLPACTSFVSASDGGTESGGVVTWNIGALAAGASVQRTVTVQVDATVPGGVDQITNAAETADDGTNGPDRNPEDNYATDTDTVFAAPDLAISKDDGISGLSPGQTTTYTLTISNTGDQDATGVAVVDLLPACTTFIGASDGGSESGGVVTWNIGYLAAGDTVIRTVTVQVDDVVPPEVTQITNTATAGDDGANGPDPDPSNNLASDTNDLALGMIGDRVWLDTDADGHQDPGERGIPGATVYLTSAGGDGVFGTPDDMRIGTVTGWNGYYVFEDVPAGQYLVSVDERTVRPRSWPTTPNPLAVTLGPAEEYVDADFGFKGFGYDVYNNFALPDVEQPVVPAPQPAPFALMPAVYAGTAVPGSSLVVTLVDAQGRSIGTESVLVDASGSWVVTVPTDAMFGYAGRTGRPLAATTGFRLVEPHIGLFYPASVVASPAGSWEMVLSPMADVPHVFTIEQGRSAFAGLDAAGFNLRTYLAPAYGTGLFSVEWLTADYVTARSTFVMVDLLYASDLHPLGVDWVAFGHELLCASWVPSGY